MAEPLRMRVTWAPTMAAPLLSMTVPVMVPDCDCANEASVQRVTKRVRRSAVRLEGNLVAGFTVLP